MLPLKLVVILTISIASAYHHERIEPDISLNTISSTPFPLSGVKGHSAGFAQSGSFANSFATAGSYSGSSSHSNSGSLAASSAGSSSGAYPGHGACGICSGQLPSANSASGAFVNGASGVSGVGVGSSVYSGNQGGSVVNAGKFWWMAPNSPFEVAYKEYKDCKPGQPCAASAGIHGQIVKGAGTQTGQFGAAGASTFGAAAVSNIDVSRNPFLTGRVKPVSPEQIPSPSNIASSSQQQIHGNQKTISAIDISKNPFLTGAVPVPSSLGLKPTYSSEGSKTGGCSGAPGSPCLNNAPAPLPPSNICAGPPGKPCNDAFPPSKPSGSNCAPGTSCSIQTQQPQSSGCFASVNGGSCEGSSATLQINKNPFLGGNYQPQKPGGPNKKPIDTASNPFLSGGSKPSFPTNQPQQPQPGFPTTQPQQPGFPTSQPQQPGFPTSQPQRPHQPSFPTNQPQRPHQPGFPTGQPQKPYQPGFPTGQPQQPGFPTGQPQQPGFPTGQPQQPGFPTGQPQQPGFPTGQPQQPGFPTGQPQQPGHTNPFLSGGSKPNQGFPSPTQQPQSGFPTPKPQKPQSNFPTNYPQQQQGFPTARPQQPGFPTSRPGQDGGRVVDNAGDELSVPCNVDGYMCVPKENCVNGIVNQYGEGILQVRMMAQYCQVGVEQCCRLKSQGATAATLSATQQFQQSASHSQSGSFSSSASTSGSKTYTTSVTGNEVPQATVGNPIFASNPGPLTPGSYSTSGIVHLSPDNQIAGTSNLNKQGPQYLPPVPTPVPQEEIPELIPPYNPDGSSPSGTRIPIYKPSVPSPSTYVPPRISTPAPIPSRPTYVQPTSPAPIPSQSIYIPPRVSTPAPTPKPTESSIIYLKPSTPNVYVPGPTTQATNAYLPPLEGGGSDIDSERIFPPRTGSTILPATITTARTSIFNTTPSPVCAAALKCVAVEYCTADGVISNTTVALTREQAENRVPLTDCQDLETGIIGKCCRDSTYKDPWPVGQLGLWNPNNGFDDGSYRPDDRANGGKPTNGNGVQNSRNQLGPQITNNRINNFGQQQAGIPQQFTSGSAVLPVAIQPSSYPVTSGQTCGARHPESKPQGNTPLDAAFGEIPWQAMILRDTGRKLLCGGVIVRADAVLTAAHCVEGLSAADVLVKGGEWRLGIDEEPKPFQIVKVAAIVTHPQYSAQNQFNDVAILFLAEKFRLDRHIDTICLPSDNEPVETKYRNANCITTGWGKDVLKINIQNSLPHRMDINFIEPNQCQASLGQNFADKLYQYNANSCICGAPKLPQNNICDVDQGSALACDLGNGHYVLSGIYSWETGCEIGNQIASFTRLDINWITAQLNKALNQLISSTASNGRPQQVNYRPQPNVIYQTNGGGVKGGSNRNDINKYYQGSYTQNQPQYQPQQYQPQHQHGAAGEPPCDCVQG